jgi:hypothetical protein
VGSVHRNFPREEFKLSEGHHYLAVLLLSFLVAYMAATGIYAILPTGHWLAPVAALASSAVVFVVFIVMGLRTIAKIDVDRIVLAIDPEGIHVADVRGFYMKGTLSTHVPWTCVEKIQYVVSGRFKETKRIIVETRDHAHQSITIPANELRCDDPHHLYETMKRYRRQFAPIVQNELDLKAYRSSAWTGLDEDY